MMQNLTDNWQHRSQPRAYLAQHELECKFIIIIIIIIIVVVIIITIIVVVIITGASRP